MLYPCNSNSSQGFLEHLPNLFTDVNVEGRWALRYAVQAAAAADASRNQSMGSGLANRALDLYGKALSALGKSLSEQDRVPDDYDLMTVVVLDIFEVCGSETKISWQARLHSRFTDTLSAQRLEGISCPSNGSYLTVTRP